jgi:TonB family protein
VILLLFGLASTNTIPVAMKSVTTLRDPILAPLLRPSHGGGGGGGRMATPASHGVLPPRATRQFVPPQAVRTNLDPKLTMQPTIIAPPDPNTPQVTSDSYGDPLSKFGIGSNGPGDGGGIGGGHRGGVGNDDGPGAGPGPCCDGGMGALTPGVGGVTGPIVLFQVEPQYSEEARKAKISGVVVLDIVVDASGHPRDFYVAHGAGAGLEDKAIEAVRQWRFKPGTKGGKAIPVRARVEVNFHLL